MSTEDSQGDAAVVDNKHIDESSAMQMQTIAPTDCAVSVVQTNPQLTAASSLLQLHNGTLPNCPDDDTASPSDNTQSRFSPGMFSGTGDGGRCGTVSWDGQSYANRSAAGLPGSITMIPSFTPSLTCRILFVAWQMQSVAYNKDK